MYKIFLFMNASHMQTMQSKKSLKFITIITIQTHPSLSLCQDTAHAINPKKEGDGENHQTAYFHPKHCIPHSYNHMNVKIFPRLCICSSGKEGQRERERGWRLNNSSFAKQLHSLLPLSRIRWSLQKCHFLLGKLVVVKC